MNVISKRGVGIVVAIAGAFAFALAACAINSKVTSVREDDGSYHLKCQTSLPRCLDFAEQTCKGTRYTVIRAADEHDYYGGPDAEHEVRNSEAIVRCGSRGKPIWGEAANPMAMPQPSDAGTATVDTSAAKKVCVPGATQACIGRAACRGGQSCLPGGLGFSVCDCGESSGGAAPSSADAGAPTVPLPSVKPVPAPGADPR